jgi:GGDEF domain-containing protein
MAMMVGEVVDELGTVNDFIGQAGGDNFVVVTNQSTAPEIRRRLKERFKQEVQTHYNFMDRQQGFIVAKNADGKSEQVPLMTLAVGIVSPADQMFSDIREITELAAEARRIDASGQG